MITRRSHVASVNNRMIKAKRIIVERVILRENRDFIPASNERAVLAVVAEKIDCEITVAARNEVNQATATNRAK